LTVKHQNFQRYIPSWIHWTTLLRNWRYCSCGWTFWHRARWASKLPWLLLPPHLSYNLRRLHRHRRRGRNSRT